MPFLYRGMARLWAVIPSIQGLWFQNLRFWMASCWCHATVIPTEICLVSNWQSVISIKLQKKGTLQSRKFAYLDLDLDLGVKFQARRVWFWCKKGAQIGVSSNRIPSSTSKPKIRKATNQKPRVSYRTKNCFPKKKFRGWKKIDALSPKKNHQVTKPFKFRIFFWDHLVCLKTNHAQNSGHFDSARCSSKFVVFSLMRQNSWAHYGSLSSATNNDHPKKLQFPRVWDISK